MSWSAAVWVLASYLVGAIPTSYLAGRLFRGIDLREHGSKNLGATNLYRVLGWRYAVPVGLFDIAKGAVPVLLFAPRISDSELFALGCGIAAILGHVFSVFVRFRGGKGVATAAGVMLGLTPLALGVAALVWVVAGRAHGLRLGREHRGGRGVSRRRCFSWSTPSVPSSCGSTCSWPLAIIWLHRANIRRLLNGTENRFGRRAAPPAHP